MKKELYMDLLKNELFALLAEKGAKLMGIADLSGIVSGKMRTGVAVAVPVPAHIVQDLKIAPTKEYYDAYFTLNVQLNDIVASGAEFLQSRGFSAYAQTTNAVKADADGKTPLPHKTVATRAGLGWIGKSCLLVTRKYGSAIRLSSLLTDAPLPCDTPINESLCGKCRICADSCPAHALTGVAWNVGVAREEILDKDACRKMQLERMKNSTGIETDLCGLCFAVCPYTERYLKSAGTE